MVDAVTAVVQRDPVCVVGGLIGATVWLKFWTTLARRNLIDPKVSRKMVHCGSAPLFLMTWPFFSSTPEARLWACIVPGVSTTRLLLAGLGRQEELVKAISRSGKRSEAFGGPFLYCCVLFAATALFWRDSAVGIVAVCQMAAGDGAADIVGRKFGQVKWPGFANKSVAGSTAFVVAGFLVCFGLLHWLQWFGCLTLADPDMLVPKLLLISVACAAVELVPKVDDNITVPLAAALLTWWLLPTVG